MMQNHSSGNHRAWSCWRRSGLLVLAGLSLLAGCSVFKSDTATTERGQSPAAPAINGPGKYAHRESQFVFYSDYPLETNWPLFKELNELRDQVYSELKLPPSNTVIQVFLFEDQDRYVNYMRARYSELPFRRAFFIKQEKNTGGSDDLMVFTYRGSHIRQDLRHELTHGLLHSVLKDVPLWLDEGLAEVYELPPENNGVNMAHLEQIRRNPFQPDMARLEQLTDVKQMKLPEYREAWAWAHFMLRGRTESKAVLLTYLQSLRTPVPKGEQAPKLLPKLREVIASPSEALLDQLATIESPGTVRNVGGQR